MEFHVAEKPRGLKGLKRVYSGGTEIANRYMMVYASFPAL